MSPGHSESHWSRRSYQIKFRRISRKSTDSLSMRRLRKLDLLALRTSVVLKRKMERHDEPH